MGIDSMLHFDVIESVEKQCSCKDVELGLKTQFLNLDPMGTLRLGHLRPEQCLDG